MSSYRGKILSMALAAVLAGVLPVTGQDAPEGPPPTGEQNVIYIQRAGPPPAEGASDFYLFTEGEGGAPVVPPPPPPGAAGSPVGAAISFVSPIGAFGGETVTGAPYSAEAVTEIEQRLADGNRIVRKTTATLYRDSDGRTRRDQTLGAIGTWVVGGEPPQVSSIHDPVEGVRYMIDHARKIVHKLPAPPFAGRLAQRIRGTFSATVAGGAVMHRQVAPAVPGGAPTAGDGSSPEEPPEQMFDVRLPPPPPGVDWTARVPGPESSGDRRTESLGKQLIEGVEAEGTRSITTIPAGAIGNDFAIEIVTERWYSPELQTVVLSLHKDSRVGETTYRLSNIQRTEPAPSLFAIPEGYQLIEPPAPVSGPHPAP